MQACKKLAVLFITAMLISISSYANKDTDLLNHRLERLSPKGVVNLQEAYGGKVILAVNTASACGFTPQYDGLEKLYQKYKDKGLVVLGFPSNDFYQEKKKGDEIVEFCRLNYGVSFPIFKKSSVKGEQANAFYKDLAAASDGSAPKWNFFKYLIDNQQNVVGVFPSQEKPLGGQLEQQISALLDGSVQAKQ